jgi:hypothetical protein
LPFVSGGKGSKISFPAFESACKKDSGENGLIEKDRPTRGHFHFLGQLAGDRK